MSDTLSKLRSDDRGASEVTAMALLLGIVMISVATIVLSAGPQLSGGQDTVEINQAERTLTQLDADATRVATGSTTTQTTDLGLRGNDGTLEAQDESGHIEVVYIHSPPDAENGAQQVVVEADLGTLVYENGDTTVGYQGGGVWRSDGTDSTMVSPPEISFQNETLTMQVIQTNGTAGLHSEVQISRSGPSTQRFPNASHENSSLQNKVDSAIVQITIESRYYKAWGRYFEDESNTIVQYDHKQQRVIIQFVALPVDYSTDAGIVATSGPGEIGLQGTGAYVDSYNSTEGPYEESNSADGKVKAAGDVSVSGDAEIDGNTHVGNNITLEGGGRLDGDARANGTIYVDGNSEITGNKSENAGPVENIPPINHMVNDRTDALSDPENNDNSETDLIQDNELQIEEEGTLDSGQYYLKNLDLQGETLILNTTNGDITIAVRDWAVLEKSGGDNSHIVVEGNNDVRLFVASEDKADVSVPGGGQAPNGMDEVHFFAERNATIDVPGDKSSQFTIFAPDNFVGAIGGSNSENADIVVTIVAPAGPVGEGQFYVQQGDIYGAIMTGNLTLGQYGQVHFDRALLEEHVPLAPNVPRLEYLYVVEHGIEVRPS